MSNTKDNPGPKKPSTKLTNPDQSQELPQTVDTLELLGNILETGKETGFSAVDAFAEKSWKQEFEFFADHPAEMVDHRVDTDRVSVRAFWETGNPLGFQLSNPGEKSIKQAFANLYAINLPGKEPGFSSMLPPGAQKVAIDIYDHSLDSFDSKGFMELVEHIRTVACRFRGLDISRVYLAKLLKKVYIANTNGLCVKYRKSNVHLVISCSMQNNRLDIGESKISLDQIEPHKIVSRAENLLGSLAGEDGTFKENDFIILSPEASAFILKEFSGHFRIDGDRQDVPFSFPAILNIVDDPLLDKQVGSVPFDDEGIQGDERFLVRKGNIVDRISNIQAAFERGSNSTGNGFRGDFSIFPGVGFSNLYIKKTILPLANLMKDAGQGLLVSLIRLKSIDQGKYLFSAYGYRFRGETLLEPVHFYFRTSFLTYFLNILKISNKLRFFHSTAGSHNIGSPYVLVEGKIKPDNLFEI